MRAEWRVCVAGVAGVAAVAGVAGAVRTVDGREAAALKVKFVALATGRYTSTYTRCLF